MDPGLSQSGETGFALLPGGGLPKAALLGAFDLNHHSVLNEDGELTELQSPQRLRDVSESVWTYRQRLMRIPHILAGTPVSGH